MFACTGQGGLHEDFALIRKEYKCSGVLGTREKQIIT
jgi:hypothetical protein